MYQILFCVNNSKKKVMDSCPTGSYCKYWQCPSVCQGTNIPCTVSGMKFSCATGTCVQSAHGLYNNCCDACNPPPVPPAPLTNVFCCNKATGGCTTRTACQSNETAVSDCSTTSCPKPAPPPPAQPQVHCCGPVGECNARSACLSNETQVPDCSTSSCSPKCCDRTTGFVSNPVNNQCPSSTRAQNNYASCVPTYCCDTMEPACTLIQNDSCGPTATEVTDCLNDCTAPRGTCPQTPCSATNVSLTLWSEHPSIGALNSPFVASYYGLLNRFLCQSNPRNICIKKLILRLEDPLEDDGTPNCFYPSFNSVLFLNLLNNLPDDFELYAVPFMDLSNNSVWNYLAQDLNLQAYVNQLVSQFGAEGPIENVATALYLVNLWNTILKRPLFKGFVVQPNNASEKAAALSLLRQLMPSMKLNYKLGCMYDGNDMSVVVSDLSVANGWDEAYPKLYNIRYPSCGTWLGANNSVLVDSTDNPIDNTTNCPNYPYPSINSMYATAWKQQNPSSYLLYGVSNPLQPTNPTQPTYGLILDGLWPHSVSSSILNRIFPLFSVETSPINPNQTCLYPSNGSCGQTNAFGTWNNVGGAFEFQDFLQYFSQKYGIPLQNCGIFTFPFMPKSWILSK